VIPVLHREPFARRTPGIVTTRTLEIEDCVRDHCRDQAWPLRELDPAQFVPKAERIQDDSDRPTASAAAALSGQRQHAVTCEKPPFQALKVPLQAIRKMMPRNVW